MLMSDIIANMIEEMLNEQGGQLELKRNDLAGKIGCVPSQINYVITSRFTPERGYIIESRRGGGGFVKITKVKMTKNEYLMHFIHSVGDTLDRRSAVAFVGSLLDYDIITKREAEIILSVITMPYNDADRSAMMRQIILTLMK